MRIITIGGPPGAGKTSIIRHLGNRLGRGLCAAKLDALHADEPAAFAARGIPATVRLSGNYCPDHIGFLCFKDFYTWAQDTGCEYLAVETAGLCGRCTPFFRDTLSVCVLPCTAGVAAVQSLAPLAAPARAIVLTRADVATHSERRVLAHTLARINPDADIIPANGLTGEGLARLARHAREAPECGAFVHKIIAGRPPRGLCSLCQDPAPGQGGTL